MAVGEVTPRDFQLIDVCHSIEDGMITYKGLPAPVITDHLTREESRSQYAHGKDLAQLDLFSVANLDGLVVRCRDARKIDATHFAGLDVAGKAVLLHTARGAEHIARKAT